MISSRAEIKSSPEYRPLFDFRGANLWLEAFTRTHGHWVLGLLILFFFAYRVLSIYPRHIWYDELTTYYLARTFSWASIIEALRLTIDAQPPTYHAIQIPALYLLGDDPRNLRWLSLIAGCVALAATFVWLRRAVSAAAALAGVVIVAVSELGYFSTEARPYALLFDAVSLALASKRLGWRILWLAMAVAFHYYALFVPIVLALTEKNWRRRAAYALALLPLLITVPAMPPAHALTLGGPHAPTLMILALSLPALMGGAALVVPALFVAVLFRRALLPWRDWLKNHTAWALLAMIPICWLMGELFTGIYFRRYAIVSLLGAASLIACLIDRLPYRALASAGFSILALIGVAVVPARERWDARPTASLVAQAIADAHQPVVSGEMQFLELHYYLSAAHREQFYRVTAARPSFTTEYAYRPGNYDAYSELIGKYAGFVPVGLEDWLSAHKAFLVVANEDNNWLIEECRRRGATIGTFAQNATSRLYSVRLPEPDTVATR